MLCSVVQCCAVRCYFVNYAMLCVYLSSTLHIALSFIHSLSILHVILFVVLSVILCVVLCVVLCVNLLCVILLHCRHGEVHIKCDKHDIFGPLEGRTEGRTGVALLPLRGYYHGPMEGGTDPGPFSGILFQELGSVILYT